MKKLFLVCLTVAMLVLVATSAWAREFAETPVPATLPLVGSGLLGLVIWGWRKRRR
jgi:hypothetical protein